MVEMNNEALLSALKLDLGISSVAFNGRLLSRIRAAQARIEEEGVILEDTIEDQELVVMYAAYLWRERVSGEDMPRMLRYALNNRLFAQKAREVL